MDLSREKDNLVRDLNDLLASLSLPITVETPYDLTPSLLLAILESILRERLPISEAIRESQTAAAKIEAMKVFLGVLEDDILKVDIGLSEIDPRRLAAGDWDEVVFVGEILCWLGHRRGQGHHVSTVEHPTVSSSSGGSKENTSDDTGYSQYGVSETTPTTQSFASSRSATKDLATTPQCIHEFEVSSFSFDAQSIDEENWCQCSLDVRHDVEHISASYDPLSPVRSRPSVRYEGIIRPVKDEIEGFEASKARNTSGSTAEVDLPRPRLRNPTRHTSPTQYTLSLLKERARLLEEIAMLKHNKAQNG